MERHDCPVCGTWACNVCGWKRQRASLDWHPHSCGSCGSLDGTMTPTRHTSPRVQWDHDRDGALGPIVGEVV